MASAKRPAALELDFEEDFLKHSTKASGSGFLKNWKEAGSITVWMHPAANQWSIWTHSIPRLIKEKDEETGEDNTIILSQRILCLEDEKLLKKQTWRDDDGNREMPPQICPIDLCVEWVHQQIQAGKMGWDTPIFRWVAESAIPDDRDEVVLYAGGITGLFQKRDKTKEELRLMHRLGVKESEAFLQNLLSRQQYMMGVMSDDDIDAGWVLAIESKSLGNRLKKEIANEIARCDGDKHKGHPKYNPYPFEWRYDENKEFAEKYDVVAKTRTAPSAEVQALFQKDPPDFDAAIDKLMPRLGTLMANLKAAAQQDMPFDQFFEAAADVYGMAEEEQDNGDDEEAADDDAPYEVQGEAAPSDAPADDDVINCDVCGAVMADEDRTCGECGATYHEDDEGNVSLATRRCGNEDCMETKVVITEDGKGTCPQCGTTHAMNQDGDWSVKVPEPEAPKAQTGGRARRRGTGRSSTQQAPKQPTPEKHSDARQSRRAKARAVAGKG